MNCKEIGIYIHIPFCKSKCSYCDFVSYGSIEETSIRKYIDVVIKEIEEYELDKMNITTIYIGGGTPSYINEKYIEEIINKIKEKSKIADFSQIEMTIEVNPGSASLEKIEAYKKIGINRISIGLQETDNKLLKQIGRIHLFEEFLQTYQDVKKVGFTNVNVDLMIGIPNQTIENVKSSVEKIVELEPKHISVYSLIIEEGTKIEKQISNGTLQELDEEEERKMYWYVKKQLELKGYKHYEISNFSKKGFESKHNSNCWEQKEYIGIGLAAHSYLDRVRYNNYEEMEKYICEFAEKNIQEQQLKEDIEKEYMLLGLRKIEGVEISEYQKKFSKNPVEYYAKKIEKLIEMKLIVIHNNSIKLTNKGIDLANVVWNEFV